MGPVIGLFLLVTIPMVDSSTRCECTYHAGGCVISKPAVKGFKCQCAYKGAWTCGGVAFPCGDWEDCPGGLMDHCACRRGGGDCGGYTDRYAKCNKKSLPTSNKAAECDCEYQPGGCHITKPAPAGFACVCVYKGFWTCSGWPERCAGDEVCLGGDYSWCACKQGGGECGAYPYSSRKRRCNFKTPKRSHCNCDRQSDWNSGKFDVESVIYNMEKAKQDNMVPTQTGSAVIRNTGAQTQSQEVSGQKTIENQSTFTHTTGIELTVGKEFEAGIPLIGAKASISVAAKTEFSWGRTKTTSVTYGNKFTCNASPHKWTRCDIILNSAKARIPYTMTLKHKVIPDCRCPSEGIYEGVAAFKDQMDVVVLGTCKSVNGKAQCTKS